jgi:hypothetical protein
MDSMARNKIISFGLLAVGFLLLRVMWSTEVEQSVWPEHSSGVEAEAEAISPVVAEETQRSAEGRVDRKIEASTVQLEVVSGDGSPISNAIVHVQRLGSNSTTERVSDELGKVTLASSGDVITELIITHQGFRPYSSDGLPPQNRAILSPCIAPLWSIQVLDDFGVGVAGAQVVIRPVGRGQKLNFPESTPFKRTFYCDAFGLVVVKNGDSILPSNVYLEVKAEGHPLSVYAHTGSRTEVTVLRLPSAPVGSLRLVENTGEPIAGARVWSWAKPPNEAETTDAQGLVPAMPVFADLYEERGAYIGPVHAQLEDRRGFVWLNVQMPAVDIVEDLKLPSWGPVVVNLKDVPNPGAFSVATVGEMREGTAKRDLYGYDSNWPGPPLIWKPLSDAGKATLVEGVRGQVTGVLLRNSADQIIAQEIVSPSGGEVVFDLAGYAKVRILPVRGGILNTRPF